ncbi:unnamed protein product, partial [Prorocentrum cordatum]
EPSLGGLLRMHDFRKSMQYRGAKPRSPAVHRRGPRMSAHSAARGKPRMLDCATLRQPSWTADFCANTAAKRLSTHGATTPLEPCVLTAATLQVQSKFADSTPAGQTREREREREREKERGREGERGREEQKKGEAKARTTLAPTTRRPGHGRAAPLAAVPALWERLMLRCSSFPHATRREFARACPFPVKTAGLAEVPNASGGGQKREEEEEEEDRATWPAGGLLRARVGSTAPPRTPSAAQPERPILESAQTRLPVHILPARPPQKNAGWTTRESNSSRGQRKARQREGGRRKHSVGAKLVHLQDIRRPKGYPQDEDPERLGALAPKLHRKLVHCPGPQARARMTRAWAHGLLCTGETARALVGRSGPPRPRPGRWPARTNRHCETDEEGEGEGERNEKEEGRGEGVLGKQEPPRDVG